MLPYELTHFIYWVSIKFGFSALQEKVKGLCVFSTCKFLKDMGKACRIWFLKVSNKETVGGDEQFWFIWGHSTTGWMPYKTPEMFIIFFFSCCVYLGLAASLSWSNAKVSRGGIISERNQHSTP